MKRTIQKEKSKGKGRMLSALRAVCAISLFAFILLGCGDPDGGDILNFAALDTAISAANAAIAEVEVSADGSNVNSLQQWVTQTVMTALNTAITAAETARTGSTTQAQVDSAVTALNTAVTTFNGEKKAGTQGGGALNYTALDTSISAANTAKAGVEISEDGEDVAATVEWVTQADMDALNAAITAAQTAKTSATTQAQVDSAVTTLNAAVETFNDAKAYGELSVTQTLLDALIGEANTLKGTAVVSVNGSDVLPSDDWVTQAQMTALENAITAAGNPGSDLAAAYGALNTAMSDFTTAKQPGTQGGGGLNYSALDTAINNANAAKADVTVSVNGSDVNSSQQWVTQTVMTALDNAITAAETAKANATTQAQVDSAVTALNTAVTTFNGEKKAGTQGGGALNYSALDTAINNANAAKAGIEISADGSDVNPSQQWVTQTVMTALTNAITAAQTAKTNSTTQAQVDSAVTALNAAVAAFNGEKKAGTQVAGTPGLAYTLITTGDNEGTYSVSRGTVTSGAVVIAASYEGLPVTEIAVNGFINTSITSVIIPDSVTIIRQLAFQNCQNLTSVTIGNNVTDIDAQAFRNSGLISVIIPDSVITIGLSAFQNCQNLTSVTIGSNVTNIDSQAFQNSGLISVIIPESVISIIDIAFVDCTNLTSVTFEGIIDSDNFGRTYTLPFYGDTYYSPFLGDLHTKYLDEENGGIGTYTTIAPVNNSSEWEKQTNNPDLNYTALDTAISNANAARTGVVTSINGSNVSTSQQWVTETVMNTLNTAITAAETVRNIFTSTQTQVDNAATTLNIAVTTFNDAKQPGTQVGGGGNTVFKITNNHSVEITKVTLNSGVDMEQETSIPPGGTGDVSFTLDTNPIGKYFQSFRVHFSDGNYVSGSYMGSTSKSIIPVTVYSEGTYMDMD